MATETTLTSAKAWSPDVSAFVPGEVIPEALILQHSTVAGRIEGDEPVLRVAFVDDAEATFVAEAAEIPEADPALSEVLVVTSKIAQLVRLSREQHVQPGAANELSESVRRAVVKKANAAFLTQPKPTSPAVAPPAGLLNISGIVNGGAVAANLDGLVDTLATLEANGGTPSGIILSPTAWASLSKFKAGTGSEVGLLGAGTEAAQRQLLGVPVTVSNALTGANGIIVDRTAVASAVGDILVAQSDQAYFSSDSVALRATWRIGWNLVHSDRIAKFTVTAPSAG